MENEKKLVNTQEDGSVKPFDGQRRQRKRVPHGEKVFFKQRSYGFPKDKPFPNRGRFGLNNENYGYGKPQRTYDSGADDERNTRFAPEHVEDNYSGDNGYRRRGDLAGRNENAGSYPYNKKGNGFYKKTRQGKPFVRKYTDDYDPHAKYNAQKVLRYKEQNYDPDAPIRLNRYLSNAGVCSRREADKYIQEGKITVNGNVITELGYKVLRTDSITVDGKPVDLEDKVYVLLNKPKDCVTTSSDPDGRKTVMDLVKGACPERIYPVGRLDRNTTGVLLLTNDGDMAAKMLHPKYIKKKIYHVYCDKPVTVTDIQQIQEGIMLDDGEIHADRIEYASEVDKKQVGIEIHSGRNRLVRRIFEKLGYRVLKLDRVYFAGLTKKNLRRGHWRFLDEAEVNMLRIGAYE